MRIKRVGSNAVFVLLLTACVSSSEVQPIGNGRYMITGRASGGLNAGKETTEVTSAANAYCKAIETDGVAKYGQDWQRSGVRRKRQFNF